MTPTTVKAERVINRFSDWIGAFSAILLLLLVANVFYDVIMRYAFNDVSIGMQELEWHLYSMIFLFGVAYTLKSDGHVRVDLVYERLGPKKRALIDILGTLLFLWPFCFLIAAYGIGFAYEAYDLGETSGDPGGLPGAAHGSGRAGSGGGTGGCQPPGGAGRSGGLAAGGACRLPARL